ncbi:MAG: 5-methyltetrahydropteroyltriglutamate--homocysteine S-methyltransferase [Spirochaetales bacterium]|nr:5-methyltetrahydropteroyltriglutamate--homocysteine S-methyltransferase [Spirochaetales bacterium]
MNIHTHILGYPRIGRHRELKKSVEGYWAGTLDRDELKARAALLREGAIAAQAGLDMITSGDFSLYDHILDTSCLVGNIPRRFASISFPWPEDRAFALARGLTMDGETIQACEMRKWFDTNYHYIVPEFDEQTSFALDQDLFEDRYPQSAGGGPVTKAVICGPLTYLWLGKMAGAKDCSRLDFLPGLLAVYRQLLTALKRKGYQWVQMDEPAAILDYLPRAWKAAYKNAYRVLSSVPERERPRILFTSYFDLPRSGAGFLAGIRAEGFHFDTSVMKGRGDFRRFLGLVKRLDPAAVISLGVVSGRNIWKTDPGPGAGLALRVAAAGRNEIWLGSSCSLLHVPVSAEDESAMDPAIVSRLAFANEKIAELSSLKELVHNGFSETVSAVYTVPRSIRLRVPRFRKRGWFSARELLQRRRLALPLLPATTIGSFPQTKDLRKARRALLSGSMDEHAYEELMKASIRDVIRKQEEIGLDVLVHGEPERNDMVEYFSAFLNGFASTSNGWVQSYGTRCVKPPIIHGDISRAKGMTLKWTAYAASLSEKPVKGMLTGPVTLVKWSFPRTDIPLEHQYYQAAFAVAEEVADLDAMGIPIIQIDEAAFREARPLASRSWKRYGSTAARAFRIASSAASDATQIHTHMCYSDFSTILKAVRDMDADVLTIETSRSEMELLDAFAHQKGFHQFGPGVYDIHSPAVPPVTVLEQRIRKALACIGPRRLWVNPDCGLKTRAWPETEQALKNMVAAAVRVRAGLQKAGRS